MAEVNSQSIITRKACPNRSRPSASTMRRHTYPISRPSISSNASTR